MNFAKCQTFRLDCRSARVICEIVHSRTDIHTRTDAQTHNGHYRKPQKPINSTRTAQTLRRQKQTQTHSSTYLSLYVCASASLSLFLSLCLIPRQEYELKVIQSWILTNLWANFLHHPSHWLDRFGVVFFDAPRLLDSENIWLTSRLLPEPQQNWSLEGACGTNEFKRLALSFKPNTTNGTFGIYIFGFRIFGKSEGHFICGRITAHVDCDICSLCVFNAMPGSSQSDGVVEVRELLVLKRGMGGLDGWRRLKSEHLRIIFRMHRTEKPENY